MSKPNTFPIVEIFGPTLQGEGLDVGRQCSFIRFAHCGFSCTWCDTKYSWDPKHPDYGFKDMTAEEIAQEVRTHYPQNIEPQHIILTGGDPAIQGKMFEIFNQLPNTSFAVETQGQIVQSWMFNPEVETVTVAPKLLNSGQHQSPEDLEWFIKSFDAEIDKLQIKIVCFDVADLHEAVKFLDVCALFDLEDVTISIGTIQHEALSMTIDRYRRLTDYCLKNHIGSGVRNFRVLMQQHVLLFGQKRGV